MNSDNESYHYSDEDMNSDDGDDGENLKQSSDFEFSSDGDEDTDDLEVAIENEYYNAKQLRDTSIPDALAAFEEVVNLERDYMNEQQQSTTHVGQWSYKAIKQLVKLHLLRTNDTHQMLKHYDRLLNCIVSGAVTQNVYEKSITGLLDRVSQTAGNTASAIDLQTLRQMYVSTLAVVQPNGLCPNERLWFKTSLKLGQLLYEINDIPQLQILIKELLKTQQQTTDHNTIDSSSSSRFAGTHLLEIYALQIQLYSRKKDNKKLRELFDRAMRVVEGGIPHPRTLALIQEMGGKMHMAFKEFESAGKTFFQAFKSYDEAGDPNRLRCLKYLVMASMLHASTINPFDSQEARPYKDDPEIVAMTNLVQAFHNNQICEFEGILRKNEGRIMDDEFIREHLADLLRTIRTQVIQNVISPYTRVRLDFIARELNGIPTQDVESLLVSLILDGKLKGNIDQVKGILVKDIAPISGATATTDTSANNSSMLLFGGGSSSSSSAIKRMELLNCDAMDQLTNSLQGLTTSLATIASDQYLYCA